MRQVNMLALLIIVLPFLGSASYGQSLEVTELESLQSPELQKEKRLWGAWSFGLFGQTFSDLTDSETYSSARLNLKGGLNLLSDLKIKSELSLVGASGFSQARFGKDSLANGINIHEALVVLGEDRIAQLEAGIINQRFLQSPLLVSSLPFPGIKGTLQYHNEYFRAGLRVQQAIPTSRTLDSQKRNEKEQTPRFATESLFAEITPHDDFKADVQVSRYRFKDLPSSVANNSRLLGNTVPFSTAAQSSFLFDYEGMLYTARATQYIIDDTFADLNLQLLENSKAPTAFNRGFLAEGGLNFPILSQMLRVGVTSFFNESDSSPAQYNSGRLGHNNMKGMSYSLAVYINQLFKIEAQFTDGQVITPNLVNTNRQNFSLALETLYVEF